MSIDQPPTPASKTGQKDSDHQQSSSRGGWKIKERRRPANGHATPDQVKETEQRTPLQTTAPPTQERKLIIGPSPSADMQVDDQQVDEKRWSLDLSGLRPIILVALGVILVSAAIAPFLGYVAPWFGGGSAVDEPDPASTADQADEDEAAAAPAATNSASNLLVRAIALPALEDEGALPVYFRLPTPADWPIDITYRTEPHTAEADLDFSPATGVITIEPGETLVELSIPLINDDVVENVELFRVILSVDPETAVMTDSRLTATVLDDDERRQRGESN